MEAQSLERGISIVQDEELVSPSGRDPSLERLRGGVFVGRHQEVSELKTALEDALSGKGRLVVLVGEPGIGKIRTAQELANTL